MTLARFIKTRETRVWALAIAAGVAAGGLLAPEVLPSARANEEIVGPPAGDGDAPWERWPCGFGEGGC